MDIVRELLVQFMLSDKKYGLRAVFFITFLGDIKWLKPLYYLTKR